MLARHRLGGLSRQGLAALVARYLSRVFGDQMGAGRQISTANCRQCSRNRDRLRVGPLATGVSATLAPHSSPLPTGGERAGRAVVSDVLELHPLSHPRHWLSGVVNPFSTTRTLKQSVQLFQHPTIRNECRCDPWQVMVGCYRMFRRETVACRSTSVRLRLCCRPRRRLFPETCQRLDW